MSGRLFLGHPLPSGRFQVMIQDGGRYEDLEPRCDLIDFCAVGFSWGQDIHGGNILSVSLLASVLDVGRAIAIHSAFRETMFDFMPPYLPWCFDENVVAAIARSIEQRATGMAA